MLRSRYKTQDGTFINVHQMYGWKKATALGERFVAKNILEERDPTKIFKLLKALQEECATEHGGPRILDVSLPV